MLASNTTRHRLLRMHLQGLGDELGTRQVVCRELVQHTKPATVRAREDTQHTRTTNGQAHPTSSAPSMICSRLICTSSLKDTPSLRRGTFSLIQMLNEFTVREHQHTDRRTHTRPIDSTVLLQLKHLSLQQLRQLHQRRVVGHNRLFRLSSQSEVVGASDQRWQRAGRLDLIRGARKSRVAFVQRVECANCERNCARVSVTANPLHMTSDITLVWNHCKDDIEAFLHEESQERQQSMQQQPGAQPAPTPQQVAESPHSASRWPSTHLFSWRC